ncbi:MAG: carbohydrate ABC transporter permease [Actinomycetota bacterium]
MSGIATLRRDRRDVAPGDGGNRVVSFMLGALAWFLGLTFFFPIAWMVLNGFKTEADANGDPMLTFSPTTEQYSTVTEKDLFGEAFMSSVVIVLLSTLIVMILAIPAAYALAIKPVEKWRDVLFFFISTKFLPIVGAILPLYVIADYLDLIGTRTALVVLYTAMNLPLAVWMLRSFFAEVPRELIEASQMDGASLWGQITSVIMPIVAPGLAATALLCLIFAWNEFFLAVQLNFANNQTVPIWVLSNVDDRSPFIARISAASTLATLPVVIAGWVAQKRMIRGLAMGAIK